MPGMRYWIKTRIATLMPCPEDCIILILIRLKMPDIIGPVISLWQAKHKMVFILALLRVKARFLRVDILTGVICPFDVFGR
jgi:hypothetical protein